MIVLLSLSQLDFFGFHFFMLEYLTDHSDKNMLISCLLGATLMMMYSSLLTLVDNYLDDQDKITTI